MLGVFNFDENLHIVRILTRHYLKKAQVFAIFMPVFAQMIANFDTKSHICSDPNFDQNLHYARGANFDPKTHIGPGSHIGLFSRKKSGFFNIAL